MRRFTFGFLLAALVGLTVSAQTPAKPDAPKPDATTAAPALPTVPTVSETAALRLNNALLSYENTQLKLQALQADLAKIQSELQATVTGMQKPGFDLSRDGKGGWVYTATPVPPADPKAPAPVKGKGGQ